jgi:hypothetical protein
MATVRFSKELIEAVVKNAKAKMQPAVDRATAATVHPAWGQKIYDMLFGDEQVLLSGVPKHWLRTKDGIKIKQVGNEKCGTKLMFSGPMYWPVEFPKSHLATFDGGWEDTLTLRDVAPWDEFKAEVEIVNQGVAAATQRQTEFVAMVTKVCNAYSTLAPALKAWPPLWDLIPENAKNRHREITVREKTETTLDVDIGKLTAMSTAAKFGI